MCSYHPLLVCEPLFLVLRTDMHRPIRSAVIECYQHCWMTALGRGGGWVGGWRVHTDTPKSHITNASQGRSLSSPASRCGKLQGPGQRLPPWLGTLLPTGTLRAAPSPHPALPAPCPRGQQGVVGRSRCRGGSGHQSSRRARSAGVLGACRDGGCGAARAGERVPVRALRQLHLDASKEWTDKQTRISSDIS